LYSQTQASIPTLELQSSSTLGTGKAISHRERLNQSEDIDVRRLVDGRANKRRRRDNGLSVLGQTDTEDEDAELDVTDYNAAADARADSPDAVIQGQVQVVDMSAILSAPEKSTQTVVVGGALRRNPDGTSMAPRVVKKKKAGKKVGQSMICRP
jgi:ATP-dependent RNA helicase DHX37/DHR1